MLPQHTALIVGAGASVFAVFSIFAFLVFGDYAPRQTSAGYLAPESGLVKVLPPRSGVVRAVEVKDGDRVHEGQTLAIVSVEQTMGEGGGAQSSMLHELKEQEAQFLKILQRQQDLGRSQLSRLETRLSGLKDEQENLRQERSALEQQKASSVAVLERMRTLHEKGYITQAEMAGKTEQVLGLEREWHASGRRLAEIESAMQDARLQLRHLPVESEQTLGAIHNQLSEVKRQQAASEADRSYAVLAPISGRVTALQIEVGRLASPAQPLLAIVDPAAALEACLLVPSRAIGFVAPGQQVRLRYAAYPYQRYGVYTARVKNISQTALRPDEWAVPLGILEPMYRVTATLDQQTIRAQNSDITLQAGMQLEADIIQEDRPLWAWFLEPLFAFRGRL